MVLYVQVFHSTLLFVQRNWVGNFIILDEHDIDWTDKWDSTAAVCNSFLDISLTSIIRTDTNWAVLTFLLT